MDLDQTRALLAVASTGSISGAAQRLEVARPTIRRRLAALEEQLGTAVAVADESGVSLTEAGELYAAHAAGLVRDHDALRELVSHVGDEPRGRVDVALPIGLAGPLAPAFLKLALRRWPKLRFRIRSTVDPVAELYRGADGAITMSLPRDGDLVVRSLGRVRFGLYASPAYVREHGTPRNCAALEQHTLLHALVEGTPPVAWPLLSGGTVAVEPTVIASDAEFIRTCVDNGDGIGLLPSFAAPNLTPVLPTVIGSRRPLWTATTRAGAALPRLSHLMEASLAFLAPILR